MKILYFQPLLLKTNGRGSTPFRECLRLLSAQIAPLKRRCTAALKQSATLGVRFKCFPKDWQTELPGKRTGQATDLSCKNKRSKVGSKCVFSTSVFLMHGFGARAMTGFPTGPASGNAGPRNGDIRFRWDPSLENWRGKRCESVREVSVPSRAHWAGSPKVTVTGTRKSGSGLVYSHIYNFQINHNIHRSFTSSSAHHPLPVDKGLYRVDVYHQR